jgi:hypothetical protein
VGLFIMRGQELYYNALKAPNHLTTNGVYGQGRGNLDYYIRAPPLASQ